MNTARMTYWTTENFVCGIFSSRPDIPVTICRFPATNQNPFSFCLGSLFRVPQIGHACCKTKTSRQLRKDYTSLNRQLRLGNQSHNLRNLSSMLRPELRPEDERHSSFGAA